MKVCASFVCVFVCTFDRIPYVDADELEWYIPSVILPAEMKRTLSVIERFLEKPIDLEGKSPSDLMTKKRRRRTRRRRSPTPDSDAEESDAPRRKKKERKKKEQQQYKSAQFIEDSDAEYGDMEAFLAKEQALREKTARLAASSGQATNMRAHGTKKRRRKQKDGAEKKRRKRGEQGAGAGGEDGYQEPEEGKARASDSSSDESDFNVFGSPKRARPEPSSDTSPPQKM